MEEKQLKLNLQGHPVVIKVREERRRVVEITRYVDVEGEEFELNDLVDTLGYVEHNDIEVTNKRMCEHFKKISVLNDCGSRRAMISAHKGPRFKSLVDQLHELEPSGLEDE